MQEFSCETSGAQREGQVTVTDHEDLIRQLSQHLREVHKVEPNEELISYLASAEYHTIGGGQ